MMCIANQANDSWLALVSAMYTGSATRPILTYPRQALEVLTSCTCTVSKPSVVKGYFADILPRRQ